MIETRESLVARIRGDDRFGVSLVVLALAFAAVGYAGGSVLAGEAVASQTRVAPVLLGCLAAWLALSATADEP